MKETLCDRHNIISKKKRNWKASMWKVHEVLLNIQKLYSKLFLHLKIKNNMESIEYFSIKAKITNFIFKYI